MADQANLMVTGETVDTTQAKAADGSGQKRKLERDQKPQDGEQKQRKVMENRAIYVTNLPYDTDVIEIEEVFKKYGIIDQGADGQKRIKMYEDDKGNFNGEALVVYFKKESVSMAINLMDDYFFRPEDRDHGTISVKEADMTYKKNKDGDKIASQLSRKDRKAAERNRAELNRKLTEWSDDEDEDAYAVKKNKWAKIAIVKNAFTPQEFDEDVEFISDLKADMHEEAEKHGTVTNVTIYDKEPRGVVTVRFDDFDGAESFRQAVMGRRYNKRILDVTIAEDRPKFKKSAPGEEHNSSDEDRPEPAAAA